MGCKKRFCKNVTLIEQMNKYIDLVIQTSKKAYTPYSKFNVGCVIVLKNEKTIEGYNIENCAFPATCCAERVALFKMHTMGYKKSDVKELYVYNKSEAFTSPCGVCRQVMSELLYLETKIILVNGSKKTKTFSVDELLPLSFRGESLK